MVFWNNIFTNNLIANSIKNSYWFSIFTREIMPSQVYFMDLRASAKDPNFKKFQQLLAAVDLKSIIQRKKKQPAALKL